MRELGVAAGIAKERHDLRPLLRGALARDGAAGVDEHEVRRAGHAVVLPRGGRHQRLHVARGELADPAGTLLLAALGDHQQAGIGGQAGRAADRVPESLADAAAAGEKREQRRSSRPGDRDVQRIAGRRGARDVGRGRGVGPRLGEARLELTRPVRGGGRELVQSPQDLGVASQEAGDEQHQQHEHDRLGGDERGHSLPPPVFRPWYTGDGWAPAPAPRHGAWWEQVALSTSSPHEH